MSNNQDTNSQTMGTGPIDQDPPEVTDIVIVSNPPPQEEEDRPGRSSSYKIPKRTALFYVKVSTDTILGPVEEIIIVINNVEAIQGPAPVNAGNYVAVYDHTGNGYMMFKTPFTLFTDKLKSGELYCLKYDIYTQGPNCSLEFLGSGANDNVRVLQGSF